MDGAVQKHLRQRKNGTDTIVLQKRRNLSVARGKLSVTNATLNIDVFLRRYLFTKWKVPFQTEPRRSPNEILQRRTSFHLVTTFATLIVDLNYMVLVYPVFLCV
jgi:hypothetical protein